MVAIRRFGAALMIAVVLGVGLGTTSLEAKKPGPPPPDPICSYLWSVITYPNVNPWILALAWDLFNKYGCTAP